MAQNFRSAFNGFNREDVVHYLEFINNKHTNQVNQLTAEAETLRQQLAEAPMERAVLESRILDMEEKNAALEEQLKALQEAQTAAAAEKEALERRCDELTKSLEESANARSKAEQERDAVSANYSTSSYRADQELEAYRRAERAERTAKERAELVYRQTNSVLSEATLKVDSAASQIGSITEQVMAQLELLQSAVDSSKLALRDAAATMYHIRPSGEE